MDKKTKNMLNDNIINKQLLFNHFAGNSTLLQKKLIEEWLILTENMELYYEWLDEWENENSQFVADDNQALAKIFAAKETVDIKIHHNPRIFILKKLAIAAVVILVVGCTFLLAKDTIFYKSIETAYGEVKLVILPDGSLVTLNANSSIKYSRFTFGDGNREVFLKGEADFSVIHTRSNQNFTVKTGNKLDVTVLGTQFSVYTRKANDKVVLRKGKVALAFDENKNKKHLILQPGDEFTKNEGKNHIEHIADTEKEVAWKNHDFLFEGTTLSEIAIMLNDDFGVTAHFDAEALADRKISGSFHAEKAEDLIDAISQLLDLNYKTKTNNVYFFE